MTPQPSDLERYNGTYETLPSELQQYYSHDQFMWLTDAQKANLIEAETEPEWN